MGDWSRWHYLNIAHYPVLMFFLFMSGHQNECTHHSYLGGKPYEGAGRSLSSYSKGKKNKKLLATFCVWEESRSVLSWSGVWWRRVQCDSRTGTAFDPSCGNGLKGWDKHDRQNECHYWGSPDRYEHRRALRENKHIWWYDKFKKVISKVPLLAIQKQKKCFKIKSLKTKQKKPSSKGGGILSIFSRVAMLTWTIL